MPILTVFDPALCCSTGVCGPEVDDALVQFAANVEWLKAQGVEIRRFNLAQEPGAFAGNPDVQNALIGDGVTCLPLLMLDGREVARGRYPGRAELSRLAGGGREEPLSRARHAAGRHRRAGLYARFRVLLTGRS